MNDPDERIAQNLETMTYWISVYAKWMITLQIIGIGCSLLATLIATFIKRNIS